MKSLVLLPGLFVLGIWSRGPDPATLRITVVYDNRAYDDRLGTGWGYAALVEHKGHTTLFDTGADGEVLLRNMHTLGIDPGEIEAVVLSHPHKDHTGGLEAVLATGVRPTVYLLASFPADFIASVERITHVVRADPGQTVSDGVATTGAVAGPVTEQALAVDTDSGLVVITGCAHPGVTAMVDRARELSGRPVRLVMGGFHLRDATESEVDTVIDELRRLAVDRLAPSHCTGDLAIVRFETGYGEDFIDAGVGRVLDVGDGGSR